MNRELPSYQYIAGLFDGEGSITITRRYKDGKTWYCLVTNLTNTYLPILETIRAMFDPRNQKLVRQSLKSNHAYLTARMPCYSWQAASAVAEKFLHCIYPYLHIKKEQAELAFEFREHIAKYRHVHKIGGQHRDNIEAWFASPIYTKIQSERSAMWQRMKDLKHISYPYSGIDEKTANSVETQSHDDMEGQYRTKQEPMVPGVCNEQVLSPKGKVCSELHGNMQSAAEMTVPLRLVSNE